MTLRAAGTRHAELRGYSNDRADVSARALTHGYAQTFGVLDGSSPGGPSGASLREG